VRPYAASLERHGYWRDEPTYGRVWYPRVEPDWRPYYRGRWVSLRHYGWTWVPYDPWGWPTHHYGRWGFSTAGSWFWIPGRTWGAAWVSWASAPGYVSWCPLGWNNRPVFQFNIHVRNYSPWRAWTILPRRHFGHGFVHRNVVQVTRIDRHVLTSFSHRDRAPEIRGYAVPRGAPIRVAGTAGRRATPLYTNLPADQGRIRTDGARIRLPDGAPASARSGTEPRGVVRERAVPTRPAVRSVPRSEGPRVQRSEGPGVRPSDSARVRPSEGPAVQRSESPGVQRSEGPGVQRSEGARVRPSESPRVQRSESPRVQRSEGSGNRPSDGARVRPSEGPGVSRSEGPRVPRSEGLVVPRSEDRRIRPSDGPGGSRSEGPRVQRSEGPGVRPSDGARVRPSEGGMAPRADRPSFEQPRAVPRGDSARPGGDSRSRPDVQQRAPDRAPSGSYERRGAAPSRPSEASGSGGRSGSGGSSGARPRPSGGGRGGGRSGGRQ
jgi:hypothetical protein